MKAFYAPLLLLLPGLAQAQTVQSAGAGNVPVNWRPAAAVDSLAVDVNGDAVADVVFTSANYPSGGAGQPSRTIFAAHAAAGSPTEVALDAAEFDSMHRYAPGDAVGAGVLWRRGGGYLDYVLTGNGSTGGRGFFRNHAAGFVAIRQATGSQMRYWWFYIEPRATTASVWISYYAGAAVALPTAAGRQAPAPPAFPNPTASGWHLAKPASYTLFDAQGRCVRQSRPALMATVDAAGLPAGTYLLVLYDQQGHATRQKVVKE